MADIQTVVQKWARNTQAGVPAYKAGVMAVTVNPMEKAAQSAELYAQKVQEAVQSGRYQAGCRSVSLGDWQQAAAEKGSARITQGVTAAIPKQQQFYSQLLPYTDRVKATIAAMPKMSESDSEQRALAAIRMMRQFKYQKRAG